MLVTSLLVLMSVTGIKPNNSKILIPEPAPSKADNPMKGLVPYQGKPDSDFPHSMEFNYLPLNAVVKGKDQYDWTALEDLLNDIWSRNHQTVFRFFLEYPKQKTGIPQYLLDAGLKVTRWNSDSPSNDPAMGLGDQMTPDYGDPRLRECLKNFIVALGKKYDGDPRIGFVTMGLLGSWGEWHTWPKDELFAKPAIQKEVMDTFEAYFKKTHVLMRYPYAEGEEGKSQNVKRSFGFHDDSFAWATLDTGKPEDSWYFLAAMKKAGALSKWKTAPIGGEIRPEAWGFCFDIPVTKKGVQDFEKCVRESHVSWLMDSGMFWKEQKPTKERTERAREMVRMMGYDFRVQSVDLSAKGRAKIEFLNQGVAPFYANWPLQVGLLSGGKVVGLKIETAFFRNRLPGVSFSTDYLLPSSIPAGSKLVISCFDPSNKLSIGFANKQQDVDLKGWLSLGELKL